MFITFEAVIDQVDKFKFGGYFELNFVSYILLDIQ